MMDTEIKFLKEQINSIEFFKVNRVEVIDENGRSYTHYFCKNVKISLQDDGHTLKLFLDKENNDGYCRYWEVDEE